MRPIERAGVCADGDNCLRYHCRACGHYWLGDEIAHACGAAVPDLEETIRTALEAESAQAIEDQWQTWMEEARQWRASAVEGQRQTAQLADRNARIKARLRERVTAA